MIYKGKQEINEIRQGKLSISEVYFGKLLVFQSVMSCFGRGYWIDEKPWINTDGWKN